MQEINNANNKNNIITKKQPKVMIYPVKNIHSTIIYNFHTNLQKYSILLNVQC